MQEFTCVLFVVLGRALLANKLTTGSFTQNVTAMFRNFIFSESVCSAVNIFGKTPKQYHILFETIFILTQW